MVNITLTSRTRSDGFGLLCGVWGVCLSRLGCALGLGGGRLSKKGSTCTFVRPCLLCVLFRPEVVVMLIGGCLALYGLGVTVEVSNTGRIPLLGIIGGATEG